MSITDRCDAIVDDGPFGQYVNWGEEGEKESVEGGGGELNFNFLARDVLLV